VNKKINSHWASFNIANSMLLAGKSSLLSVGHNALITLLGLMPCEVVYSGIKFEIRLQALQIAAVYKYYVDVIAVGERTISTCCPC